MQKCSTAPVPSGHWGFFGKSGLISSQPGGSYGLDTGAGELILSLVMGAFCGLVLGMIVSNVLRYCSMVMGRNIGGHSWAIYCAILGAALFAWWSVNDEE